jgi:hypothetical protein
MPPPVFPPVRPLPTLDPWGTPQTLAQRPRLDAPQVRPILGAIEPPEERVRVSDSWHIAQLNGSSTVNVGQESVLVCASPPGQRNLFVARNVGGTNLYIDFGLEAAANRSVFVLVPGAILFLDTVVPQDDVYCVSDNPGGVLGLAFSNI